MTKPQKRDEWLRDVEARQRNVVFPDTAVNEGRFWRNLFEGKQRLTRIQTAGIAILAVFACGLFILIVTEWTPEYGTWGSHLAAGLLNWVLALGVLGGFLLLLKFATRKAGKR